MVVATVADMTSTARTRTRTHSCVFFDDGDTELLCVCGERALHLPDEDGGIVVVLYREPSRVTQLPGADRLLAASA